ncbi:MAG: P-II family nitrogen regulator [Bacillota bacterium]|jgi:nitrogen regulatory protein PII|nr:P-II family nitrogen regulator [Bacillota bacterium]
MENSPEKADMGLFCVIVNYALGSRILKIAKEAGVTGGTVILGKGTMRSRILEFLELADVRKEIVFMVAEKRVGEAALERLVDRLDMTKPNHGIAFSMPVKGVLGLRCGTMEGINESRGVASPMYHAIFVIVDKGGADTVIDAAKSAGAKGATVINARGSGIHETAMLFSMPIEPEKDMVLILSEASKTQAICEAIRQACKVDEPGRGIIFVLDVDKTYGLYQ